MEKTYYNLVEIAMQIWGALFCLVCMLVLVRQKAISKKRNYFLAILLGVNAMVLALDSIGRIFKEEIIKDDVMFGFIKLAYFIVFFLGYLMPPLFIKYLEGVLELRDIKPSKIYFKLTIVLLNIGMIFLIMTQFNGFYYYFDNDNVYHRTENFTISMVIGILGIVVCAVMILTHVCDFGKNDAKALLIYIILPAITLGIQVFYKGISLLNIATTVCLILLFAAHYLEMAELVTRQHEELLKRDRKEAIIKYNMLQAQIKPHFLFNALGSIYLVCEDDNAKELLHDFTQYLRANIDIINKSNSLRNVPFKEEMKSVEAYLKIEKLRFGDRLNINICLNDTEFMVPPLCISTIVENAVRHGICKKDEGGTISLMSDIVDGYNQVTIKDDGVGFDVDMLDGISEEHIGVTNTKMRIESIAGGVFDIKSEIGIGTTVVIKLPIHQD